PGNSASTIYLLSIFLTSALNVANRLSIAEAPWPNNSLTGWNILFNRSTLSSSLFGLISNIFTSSFKHFNQFFHLLLIYLFSLFLYIIFFYKLTIFIFQSFFFLYLNLLSCILI